MVKEKQKGYSKRPPSLTQSQNPEVVAVGDIYIASEVISADGLAQLLLDLLRKDEVQNYLYENQKQKIKKGIG